ncbi:lytic polysaccharide monooxygenase [Nocardiopsis potens]|uniref:lytic polysaccharide monooxygenase n=1 Tax=Nocardiopsis potens TaxID=1246458 RepID=UPI000349D268|nr:lytic polysaccharide monooxygenase [Nocardiopsis potens]
MRLARALRTAAVLTGIPLALGTLTAGTANAHGTMGDPVSRIAACFEEGPENPQSEVCKNLVAENGTQPLYDWNEVNIPNADGRHREIIPDGQLCSAGRAKYSGLDAPGAWHTTALPSSGQHTFTYTASAPHRGYFELYVTKDGWSQDKRLTWDALEPEPFLRVDDPEVVDGTYRLTGALPEGKSGQHMIYAIWQRTDSPEAFYSCSDVSFGGGGASQPAAPAFAPEDTGGHDGHAAGHGGDEGDGNASAQGDGYVDTVGHDGGGSAEEDGGAAAGASDGSDGSGGSDGTAGAAGAGDSHASGHGAHAASGADALPLTGSAITGLFLAAMAALVTGFATMVYTRKRRTAGTHRA